MVVEGFYYGCHAIDRKHPDGGSADQLHIFFPEGAKGGKKNFKAPARESADKKIFSQGKSVPAPVAFYTGDGI